MSRPSDESIFKSNAWIPPIFLFLLFFGPLRTKPGVPLQTPLAVSVCEWADNSQPLIHGCETPLSLNTQTARLGRGMLCPLASVKGGSFSPAGVKPIFSQNSMESRTERRWLKEVPPKAAPSLRQGHSQSPHGQCECLGLNCHVMVCKGLCVRVRDFEV